MVYVCAPWEKKAADAIPSIRLMIVTWLGVTESLREAGDKPGYFADYVSVNYRAV